MASKEQELAIKIAGKVENSFKNSITEGQNGLEKLASVAKKAAAVAAAAFAAVKVGEFISDAVEEYSTFEQSMANTSAVANASAEDYAKLEQAARDAGKATTFTASEAADALGYMALAGWDVNTSTQALTPILQLAEATQADLATTSDQVTDSMSAMGLGVDELTNYLDVVVATNNNANTTASDLMEAFIGCGGAAKSAGMDYQQTATALGILANNGVKGAEAGTALNSMLVRMTTKDKAITAMQELGVAVYDSSGNMRDMRQILIDVNKAMDGMSDSQRNAYMSAIAGTNYYTQFGYLLDGVKEGADGTASAWDNLTEKLDGSKGALEAMDKTVTSTLQGSIARLQSAVSDFKITMVEQFGGPAAEIIDQVASRLPDITENFSAMISALPIDDFVSGVGNMTGAFLDFVSMVTGGETLADAFTIMLAEDFGVEIPESVQMFLDVMQSAWDTFTGFIGWIKSTAQNTMANLKETFAEHEPQLQTIMDLLADLQSKFEEAFGGAQGLVGDLVEGGLPALVGVLVDVLAGAASVLDKFVEWDGFIPTVTTLGTAIAGFKLAKMALEIGKVTKAMLLLNAAKIKDKAETIYLNALYAKDAIVKGASTAATWAQTAATTAWNAICTAATAVTTALGAAFTFLTSPIGLVILAIGAVIAIGVLLYKNWDTVKEKASQLGERIVNVFNNLKEKASEAIQKFAEKFPAAFAFISSVFEAWKNTITNVISGIKQVFQGIIQFFKGVFTGDWKSALEGLKNIFSGAFKALSSLAMAPLNALKGVVEGAWNAIDTMTGGKLTELKNKASEAWNNIKETASETWSNVKETAGTVLQAAKDTVSEKLSNIKAAYDEHGGGIKGVAAAAMEGVKGYYTAGYTFIDNLTGGKLSAIKDKIKSKMDEAKTAVSGVLDSIKQAFSDKLEAAKSVVTGIVDKIKGVFNFEWKLPELKLPHVSVSGGKAPYGIAGQGSLPKFSVEWYAEGGIMTKPTLFGMDGNNPMVGGEAGAEAIIPLSELWSNMKQFIASAVSSNSGDGMGNALSALTGKISDMAAGMRENSISSLLGNITGGGNQNQMEVAGTGMTVTYAPVFNITGSGVTKDDVVEAERMSQEKFNDMMEQWKRDNDRKGF